jgi:acyl-CoA thioesterase-1
MKQASDRKKSSPKHRWAVYVGAVAFVMLASWAGAAAPTPTPERSGKSRPLVQHTVAFIGDSLTLGHYASQKELTFAARVQREYGKAFSEETHVRGKAGAMIKTVQRPDIMKLFMSALDETVDVIVVELGTNDVGVTPVREFKEKYEKFLAEIRQRNPEATLLCLGVWRDSQSTAFDSSILQAAKAANGYFLPLDTVYRNVAYHAQSRVQTPWGLSDAFHPSDEGHRVIAENIIAALTFIDTEKKDVPSIR